MPSITVSSSLQLQYHTAIPSQMSQEHRFKINYVLCMEIFTCNQEEKSLVVNPESDTIEFLIREICNTNQMPDFLTLELFNKNGCPFNVNEYTMKCKLFPYHVTV